MTVCMPSPMLPMYEFARAARASYRKSAECLHDPPCHFHVDGGASRRLGSVAAPGGAARESRLLEDLQIGDDVLDVCGIGNAAIGHAVALHLCLRVLDIGTQIIFVPNEIRPFHRVRVAKILKRR